MADWSNSLSGHDLTSNDIDDYLYQGTNGRRWKTAVTLTLIWGGTIGLHLVSWGALAVLSLTTFMGIHAVRVLFTRPLRNPLPLQDDQLTQAPFVSLLVAAKNEEAVIETLVETLCDLDYPHYDLWVVDDSSTDRTSDLLRQLEQRCQRLKVVYRPAGSTGGKSGALNQILPIVEGEIIGVFDADATAPKDLLRRVVPMFQEASQLGAVQVRKAIANRTENFWTRGQAAEMCMDSYFQQQRIALGGIGELRGNGQFVRRDALFSCGGWNEETITDDLDLTLRLHLDHWDIRFLLAPPVEEEGVTRALALWHQRNRWAEGGYQRYVDYWRLIANNRLGPRKTLDLAMFWITQYGLPTATVPDFMMAVIRHRPPVLTPIAGLTVSLSLVGMFISLRRTQEQSLFSTTIQTFRGILYMFHWFLVIASTVMRMSVRPKRLKWVKTVHEGNEVLNEA